MTIDFGLILALLASYVVGSIPTGLWLGQRLKGIDIREHGSRNIGATNTMRVLGKGLGAAALVGDMLKGVVAVLLFAQLSAWPYAGLACGIASILGHSFSIFLGFKGGKGVATSTGVYLALAPIPTLIAAAVFAVVVGISRMVSAGSMAAAIALAALLLVFPASWPLRLATVAMALFVVIKHRSNIGRIVRGEENRI